MKSPTITTEAPSELDIERNAFFGSHYGMSLIVDPDTNRIARQVFDAAWKAARGIRDDRDWVCGICGTQYGPDQSECADPQCRDDAAEMNQSWWADYNADDQAI